MSASTHHGLGLHSRLFPIAVLTALPIKCILAAITPESVDFTNIATGASWVVENQIILQGPYTFSVNFISLFYRLWLLIPVDHQWIYSGQTFIPSSAAYLLVFLLKIPLIIFDVLTGFLIYRLVYSLSRNQNTAALGAAVWLLNPYLTIIIEMDGTMDIIGTFFTFLSCYLFVRGRYSTSGVLLAVATMARFFPIALIPFFGLALVREGKRRNLYTMIVSYLAPLALVAAVLLARFGTTFLEMIYSIPAGGNREFTWFLGFRPNTSSTSGAELSSVAFVCALVALLMLRIWKYDRRLILDVILIGLITYVGFSHFNRYYTIWVIPFLTLDLAMHKDGLYRKAYAALFTLFFVSAFIYNFAYWWNDGLFFIYESTPLITQMVNYMREAGSILRLGDLGTTFTQSILAGTCIIYATMVIMRNFLKSSFSPTIVAQLVGFTKSQQPSTMGFLEDPSVQDAQSSL